MRAVSVVARRLSDAFSVCRPQSLLTGMNKFLASLEITFRRDPTNYRPRVNKLNSIKDREQKGTCSPCRCDPPVAHYSGSIR